MKTKLLVTVFVATSLVASIGLSQDGIFSGRGIGNTGTLEIPRAADTRKAAWPKILDFSRDDSTQTARTPFSALFKKPNFQKPNFDFFKPKTNPEGIIDRRTTLADLLPKRDPNRPTIIESMNAKSKKFQDKMTGWFSGKNQDLKSKSADTWNSVLSDFREIQQRNGIVPQANPLTPRPNVRTADATGQPRVRF